MKKNFTEIEIPFGVKDSELYQFTYTIPDGYSAEIKDGKVIVKKKESEDERIRKALILFFKHTHNWANLKYDGDEIVAYLEKQKEQKPAEWSNIDELKLQTIEAVIAQQKGSAAFGGFLPEELIDFLKYLRPQPKAEWSDEDEKMRLTVLQDLANIQDVSPKVNIQPEFDWLKSLRPQPHWKPSEEQMGALKYALGEGGKFDKNALESLYNDLKSL